MKRFAVGFSNFFDNNLVIEVIEADSVQSAIQKHSEIQSEDMKEWVKDLPKSEEEIKAHFFNGDCLIGWVEIGA